jgi:hypothetical protein
MIDDKEMLGAAQAAPETSEQAIPAGAPIGHEVPGVTSVGGIMEMKSLTQQLKEEKAAAEKDMQRPVITGLAGYIRKCWDEARSAKEQKVERQMLRALRQRRGEYDPDMLRSLQQQGSAIVYMMLTSNKCRSAAAWLREALGGMPWVASPTPVSDIDEQTRAAIVNDAQQKIMQVMQLGIFPSDADVKEYMLAMRDKAFARIQQTAKERAARMTEKMKDQLMEGGFEEAVDEFIDDLVDFPGGVH